MSCDVVVRSYYWAYVAKGVAKSEKELCLHAKLKTLIVNIGYQENIDTNNVNIRVFCPVCYIQLDRTGKGTEKKFLEFYGAQQPKIMP